MKSVFTSLFVTALLASSSLSALELKWYPGAFPENESGKITTSSVASKPEKGISKYAYAFASAKSNQASVQYPLTTTEKGFTAIELEAKGVKSAPWFEVWLKDDKGSKFQGKMRTIKDQWQRFKFSIKDTTADRIKFVQLVIPNRDNGKRGMVLLKTPQFGYAAREWFTGAFKDAAAGKVTTKVTVKSQPDESALLSIDFQKKSSNAGFFQTATTGADGKNSFVITAKAVTGTPTFEIWAESTGWKFQGKMKVNSKDWKDYSFKIQGAKGKDLKYLRLLASPKDNSGKVAVQIKFLKFVNQK